MCSKLRDTRQASSVLRAVGFCRKYIRDAKFVLLAYKSTESHPTLWSEAALAKEGVLGGGEGKINWTLC
jgi:hypothetical protein